MFERIAEILLAARAPGNYYSPFPGSFVQCERGFLVC